MAPWFWIRIWLLPSLRPEEFARGNFLNQSAPVLHLTMQKLAHLWKHFCRISASAFANS